MTTGVGVGEAGQGGRWGGQRPLEVTLTESPCLVQPRRVPEREPSIGGTWNWNFRAASPCLPLSHGVLPLPGQRLNTQLPAGLGQSGVPQLAPGWVRLIPRWEGIEQNLQPLLDRCRNSLKFWNQSVSLADPRFLGTPAEPRG